MAWVAPLVGFLLVAGGSSLGAEAKNGSEDAVCPSPKRKFVRQAWAMSGGISDIAVHCNTIFVAGDGSIGRRTGPLAAVSAGTGRRLRSMPELSGQIGRVSLAEPLVRAMTEDGDGGWFVAGAFAFAGERGCPGLVHVLRDGRLDRAFCPRTNGPVEAVERLGEVVYLGGDFTKVDGRSRRHLAAVRVRDGGVLPWAPHIAPARYCPDRDAPGGLSVSINALAASSTGVYVGGSFSAVNSVRRLSLAALDPKSGAVLPFNARLRSPVDRNCDGPSVDAVLTTRNGVVVSGLEAVPKRYLEAFLRVHDATSGRPIRPRLPRLAAVALAAAGSRLYVGGWFGAAAFDLDSGTRLPWRPRIRGDVCCYEPDAGVHAILPVRGVVYLGGNFAAVGGSRREFAAAVKATSGKPLDWDPRPNGPVLTIGRSGKTVVVGGTLASVNVRPRAGLAAIDGSTGKLLDWAPRVVGQVKALLVNRERLFVGGNFKRVSGAQRQSLAAFDLRSRRLVEWSANVGGDPIYGVTALAATGDRLYVGGDFGRLELEPRKGAGAVDLESGDLADWDPDLSNRADSVQVHTIAVARDTVYLGGEFEEAAGVIHNGVVAVDLDQGDALLWNPRAADLGYVYSLAVSPAGVYLAGWFEEVGDTRRVGVALVDSADGRPSSFNARLRDPRSFASAQSVVRVADKLFIAGDFEIAGGRPRAGLAAVDATTGRVLNWNPRPPDRARSEPDTVTVGGGAVIVDGYIQGNGEQLVVHPLAGSLRSFNDQWRSR